MALRGDGFAVSGRIAAHDGAVHVVETEHGTLTLDAAAVSCEGEGCPATPGIAVEGEPWLLDVLMPALIEAFAARRGVAVEREGAVYRLEDRGEVLRIALHRALEGAELTLGWGSMGATGEAAGGQRVLALDALVPVVSPGNSIDAVSRADLARLFAGEIEDWAELGGRPGPVSLHLPAGASGRAFEERVLRPAGLTASEAVIRHADGAGLSRAVASDPGAVGVTTLGATRLVEAVALAGPCGLVSRPGPDAVRAGDWPLVLPLAVGLPARPLPRLAADLALFATSPEAQPVIRRAGLLDQSPREIPLAEQGERLAAAILAAGEGAAIGELQTAIADLRGLTRLTPTFRFENGAELDAPSREAAERLAARIAEGAHDGHRLVFMGFGDGTGAPDRTLALSSARARAVLDAVRAQVPPRPGGPVLSAQAHGAVLPVACDDDLAGRRLNRRVELWTR